jgi:Flp pilus assembly protein TadG
MVGVLIVVFMGFLAIAVDLGQGYLQRRANQNGADAAAIAAEQALLANAGDSSLQSSIAHVLRSSGYQNYTVQFLSAASPTPGNNTSYVYVDAQYGQYPSGSNTCTPFSPAQYVGNGTVPAGAKCVKVIVSTSKKTLFASAPILGFPQIGASAQSSAGLVSVVAPGAAGVQQPPPGPWNLGGGEGWAIWGGLRADSTTLCATNGVALCDFAAHPNAASTALSFADSGWNSGNDVRTSCNGTCDYQATQNFKGIADPQCFPAPPYPALPASPFSSCTGPNGAHGNAAAALAPGTLVQVVVVRTVDHDGNSNNMNPIGLATLKVLASCPGNPVYLQSATNGVCGTIQTLDYGVLNLGDNPYVPSSPPAPVIGNTR